MYGDYTTTFEEYQAQRYEGASTIFGPTNWKPSFTRFENGEGYGGGAKSASRPSPEVDLKKMINLLGEWKYDT